MSDTTVHLYGPLRTHTGISGGRERGGREGENIVCLFNKPHKMKYSPDVLCR